MLVLKSKKYFEKYFADMNEQLHSIKYAQLHDAISLIKKAEKLSRKIIFVGNGGSASIAGHLTVDFINAVGVRAVNFNDPGIITCFANDYGYENWVSKALDCYAKPGDVLVLISSSGQSKNMLIGADKAKYLGVDVITLTGFSSDNPLKKLGSINLWANSDKYNIVEMTHHVWLLAIADYIIELNNKEQK